MPDLFGGRLLCFFPDTNLFDGAAEPVSDGFFDLDNIPPWDTWVSFFDDGTDADTCFSRYLLVYVPNELIPLADLGILLNPERCMLWLEDTETLIRSRFV